MEDENGTRQTRPRNVLPFPQWGLVDLEQVRSVYPVSKTTIYKESAEGKFPRRIKKGTRTFWDAVEVRRCLADIGVTIPDDGHPQ